MQKDFLENVMADWRTITLESIISMTKSFNLEDFYSKDFTGMAEIIITPHQVISMYGNNSLSHDMLFGYISRYIMDAKVFNPIISIRCRSEANMKAFCPELLRNGFAITEDMNKVLEKLYEQLELIRDDKFKIFVSLQEFRNYQMADVVKDISNIPRGGEDKNIIGISIEEFMKLNQQRNNKIDKKRDNELEI